MKLLLPLKFYDAAGRVIPPVSFYFCLMYLCRSFLIFIASLSGKESSDVLLRLFYPVTTHLYLSLGVALPVLAVFIIVGFREKIWAGNKGWLFSLIRPLTIISILSDLIFHLAIAKMNHWQFSWTISCTTMIGLLCLYFVIRDKHTKLMVADWKKG
ncbi:DUF2919 family protein [Paraglaciecola sp. 2405UD69-4]|uniref:DUF2919 family protein n=1 Tax=Paraglaciecola sp. 2405UD69-4 TaxID=3391836 RepID=UPI0039C93D52